MAPYTLRFLMLLLAGGLLLPACDGPARGGGGGGGDDDDATADDDDSTPPADDDDDVTDDDDDVTGDDDDDDDTTFSPGPACPAGLTEITEIEPNDDPDAGEIHDLGTLSAPGFCVSGESVCGNDGKVFTGGVDFLTFQVSDGGTADFILTWGGSGTDMDGVVQDDTETILHDFEMGFDSETGTFALAAGTGYVLRVACWEGESGGYAASFAW